MEDDRLYEETGDRPKIKVTDRRKFNVDGEPRESSDATPSADSTEDIPPTPPPVDAASEVAPDQPSADSAEGIPPTPPPVDTASEAAPDQPSADSAEEIPPTPPPVDTASEAAPDQPSADSASPSAGPSRISTPQPSFSDLPRDFSAFVESMYLEAMLFLGAIADPRTGQVVDDPELAKYKIDILGMLQEKTEGNLSAEEQQQLEEALYQLRMVYVQKTTPPAPLDGATP